MYTVRLENTVTHQIYEQQVEDTNDGGKLYFRFGISTIDLADGEYILTVFGENGDVLAEDLLRIGDFNPQTLQYTKGEKTYLDITVDAILQREKNVSITDIHTRILPDLGNDAVEIVYVDAQPLYDSARSEGYDEGYDLGIQQSYPKGYEDGYNKGNEDGYNTGSAEAYPRGYEDGYGNGKTDGYNEGYGVGYGEGDAQGYENGYNTATDTFVGELKELYVDGNGVYKTKYSEDITLTGEDFYDYAALHNKVYNTNMYFHKDISIDIWIRFNAEIPNDNPNTNIDIMSILGTEDVEYSNYPLKLSRLAYFGEDAITLYYGQYYFVLSNVSTFEWMHIKINSATKEVSINGVQCAEMYSVDKETGRFTKVDNWDIVDDVVSTLPITLGFINNPADTIPVGVTQGFEDIDLGMVIIDGVKFIPTAQGYKRTDTDELIEDVPVYIANGEDISYVYNNIISQGAYKTVTVEVDTDSYYGKGFDDGYDVGYDVGTEDGYDVGYADGEQASFGIGYEQGQKDIAENARVLEVTENGLYVSKFSEIPKPDVVTGVYPDGTEFYNFAELTNITYNTGIKLSENTKVEIWYKPRDLGFLNYGGIIGTIEDNTSNAFGLFTSLGWNYGFTGRIGGISSYYNPNDLNKWFHLELSFADGFVVDGVKYKTYLNNTGNLGRYLFINDYDTNANGYFGMIKIDDTIIIPTEEGFLNTNTGTLLEVVEDGLHSFTNNTPKVPEGELYKTVNVNVTPKIDIAKEGITFAYSTIKELPKWADFSNVTSMRYMFAVNSVMTEAPYIDTNKVTNFETCFWNMYQLKTAPNYDTENATKVRGMFSSCHNLETAPTYLNLLKCEDMQEMFYDVRLKDYSFLANWDINPKANMGSMITAYDYVEYIPAIPNEGTIDYYQSGIIQSWADFSKLTYFGGYIGRKYNLTSTSVLTKCPNLTYESCISILNNLYDFTGNGEAPASNQGTLKVHQNFINNVGDDITIGTNKGWTITT